MSHVSWLHKHTYIPCLDFKWYYLTEHKETQQAHHVKNFTMEANLSLALLNSITIQWEKKSFAFGAESEMIFLIIIQNIEQCAPSLSTHTHKEHNCLYFGRCKLQEMSNWTALAVPLLTLLYGVDGIRCTSKDSYHNKRECDNSS